LLVAAVYVISLLLCKQSTNYFWQKKINFWFKITKKNRDDSPDVHDMAELKCKTKRVEIIMS